MKTRNIWKILLVVLVLGLVLLGGGYIGYRAYLSARQTHLIKQAQHYLAKAKPDVKKALLCLQRVLKANPRNVEACRLMAELSEAGRSPGALVWRSRVVELNPGSLDDRLALVQSALIFRDYSLATNALAGVDAPGRKTAVYHNLAGEVATAVGQLAQAEADFQEAAQLEPTNPVPQLNLAVVRLHGTNAAVLAEARAALKQISSTSSALRCQALRELVVDSLRFRQTNVAMQLSGDLVQQTNSAFSDRLLRLDVLKANQNAQFKPALAAVQREASTNTAKIYELSQWQMPRIGPAETEAWLRSLSMSYQTNQPVALLMAQCQTMLGNWRGLQNTLKSENWADLEFTRHALLARALRGQDLTEAAKGEWDLALKSAAGQKQSLITLLRLAAAWKWQSEGEDLLWTIVNQYPGERWAFAALNQALYANGRTRPLMMLYSQELRRLPADLDLKNNLAMTALLLDAQELNPHQLAREVYQQDPTNSAFISTYAFSLHLQKKDAEALKIMERLTPQELKDPSIAGYYSLVLQATGNKEKARSYLNLAFKGPLLPEERKMFEQARAGT
jgi:cytochrome c-type biogenesis protein CcmH/NrfG